jgi:hypothetical protein
MMKAMATATGGRAGREGGQGGQAEADVQPVQGQKRVFQYVLQFPLRIRIFLFDFPNA